MLASFAKNAARRTKLSSAVGPRARGLTKSSKAPKKNNALIGLSSTSQPSIAALRPSYSKTFSMRSYSNQVPAGDELPMTQTVERVAPDGRRIYSRLEVAQHNTPTDGWLIIDDKVYNVTSWIEFHPGGEDVLLERLGKDASHDFGAIGHSHRAHAVLDSLLIGHVKERKRYSGL